MIYSFDNEHTKYYIRNFCGCWLSDINACPLKKYVARENCKFSLKEIKSTYINIILNKKIPNKILIIEDE